MAKTKMRQLIEAELQFNEPFGSMPCWVGLETGNVYINTPEYRGKVILTLDAYSIEELRRLMIDHYIDGDRIVIPVTISITK